MNNTINSSIKFKSGATYPINYNRKYNASMPDINDDELILMQDMLQSKADKREKSRDRWNKASVVMQGLIALGLVGGALVSLWNGKIRKDIFKKSLEKEGDKLTEMLKPVDVSGEKTFEQLTLSDNMKKVVEDLKTKISRADALKKKGGTGGTGVMLYGEPGGGKNAYVYALAKYMQEKFPGSELYEVNVLKFNSKWHGESENNIIGFIEEIVSKAKANPKKKYVVFMDEFDSIARNETNDQAKAYAEKMQNAFKTTLTKLTAMDNIQVVAATNKAEKGKALTEMLDDAILNRFPEKIHVPLPSKDQLKNAIVEYYKKLPSDVVDKALTNPKNTELDNICKEIAKESHHASFRDLQYIFDHARVISESANRKSGSPITIKDLKQAVKKHGEGENWGARNKKDKDFQAAPSVWQIIKQIWWNNVKRKSA